MVIESVVCCLDELNQLTNGVCILYDTKNEVFLIFVMIFSLFRNLGINYFRSIIEIAMLVYITSR